MSVYSWHKYANVTGPGDEKASPCSQGVYGVTLMENPQN